MKNTRREFVKNSLIGAASLSFGGILPGFSPESYGRIMGSNDRLMVSCMGLNGRGYQVGTNFANQGDSEVLYACDVDSRASDKFAAAAAKLQKRVPKKVTDFRRTLEDKDVDILMVAAPDHWHATAAILACQAGKHVYLEKPCSHSPHEGELIISAARKYDRVVQMGNQRRSWPNSIGAINELRSGAIGKPYFAKTWYTNNRPSIGIGKRVEIPSWLDFELWQGPASREQYRDNIVHYNWHWFWNWGTGEGPNTGTHVVDLARWGLEADFPVKVSSTGGRYRYQDDWQTPDTQVVSLEFPNKTMITWEGRSCNKRPVEGSSTGVMFYGETGSVLIGDSSSYKVFDIDGKLVKHIKTETEARETPGPTTAYQQLDSLHLRNFFDGIRKGSRLNSEIAEGHKSTLLMQLGNIALRSDSALNINPENGHIINNSEAMKYWTREYEPGWELKV